MNALLISLAGGFLAALGTAIALSPRKARQYPGGSFIVGLGVGFTMASTTGLTTACGVAGVTGWAIYLVISRLIERRLA